MSRLLLCLYATVVAFFSRSIRALGVNDETGSNVPGTQSEKTEENEGYTKLVDWVEHNGGRVDTRLGLGGNFNGTVRGAVALDNIAAGTELLYTPWRLVLGTTGDTAKVPAERCNVLKEYANEVRAGKDSFWYPYLSMDTSLDTSIPTVWHASALEDLQGLPPHEKTQGPSLTDWFSDTCAGGKPFEQLDMAARQALLAVITRSAGMRFLPIFDLINHHKGEVNTRSHADHDGNSVFATVDITKGSGIFNSYRDEGETSSDMFLRYGFIESWPQQWAWIDAETSNEQKCMILPGGSVAIYPHASMAGAIGMTLAALQAKVKKHNIGLVSAKLSQFCDASVRLLESLPTTWEEDTDVLLELVDRMAKSSTKNDDLIFPLQDRICAVKYRIQFKKAIETALGASRTVLARRQEAQENEL